jgi:hypothetical protein
MPSQGDRAGRAGPVGDLDERLVEALTRVGTLEELTAALQREDDVLRARPLPGVVKTHPPIVELLVEQRQDDGSVVRWIYDLVVEPDGRLRVRARHPRHRP